MEKKDYQNHNPIVGTNIRNMRKKLGLSAKDLSARLESYGVPVSPQVLCHVEKGRNNASVDMLIALTRIFGCEFNDFFRKT